MGGSRRKSLECLFSDFSMRVDRFLIDAYKDLCILEDTKAHGDLHLSIHDLYCQVSTKILAILAVRSDDARYSELCST